MAQLTLFTYRPGRSILHTVDVRSKFFIICLISLCLLAARIPGCLVYALILFFFFNQTGLGFWATLKRLEYFLILLLFVFVARALTVNGHILFSFYGMSVSDQGVIQGVLVAVKFFLVMVTGLVFACTTRPASLKSAVQWFLKPVPFVPEKRVGVMISLALGFLPVILGQARQISDAQKARCFDLQKNPVKKTIRLVLPLLKKIFLSADSLVLAMESRCYTDDRTDPEFTASVKDAVFVAGGMTVCLGLLCF